jgi:hypothetical protein
MTKEEIMCYLAHITSRHRRAVTAVYKNLSGDVSSSRILRILHEHSGWWTEGFALWNKCITFNLFNQIFKQHTHIRLRDRGRWTPAMSVLVRSKLARDFILHRLNYIIYSGRCLATSRKNTLPQFSTRLHGVVTHKTTVSNLYHCHPHPPPKITKYIFPDFYSYLPTHTFRQYETFLGYWNNIITGSDLDSVMDVSRSWVVRWIHRVCDWDDPQPQGF